MALQNSEESKIGPLFFNLYFIVLHIVSIGFSALLQAGHMRRVRCGVLTIVWALCGDVGGNETDESGFRLVLRAVVCRLAILETIST
jgi:hypothetical protein